MSRHKNVLIGKILTGMKISEDKMALLLSTTEGDLVVGTDADCCSHTWIEHVELPALGFPCLVTEVSDLNMPDLGSPDEYDVIAYYGCKISTDKGDIIIDYRNSSNGYYGGSLSWPGDYHYGGVGGQNVSKQVWKEII